MPAALTLIERPDRPPPLPRRVSWHARANAAAPVWALLSLGAAAIVTWTERFTVVLLRLENGGGSQSLGLAPARGGFVESTFPEEGRYPFIDHGLRRAEGGARGHFEVEEP